MSAMSELSIELDEAELAAIDEHLGTEITVEDAEYLNSLLMEQLVEIFTTQHAANQTEMAA